MATNPLTQPDLRVRLDRAIESYRSTWEPVDIELYDLCRRRPSHRDFAEVYTKVAVIGRVYEAGVSRAFRASGDPEAATARGLIEHAEMIDAQLTALNGRKFDRQVTREIVELHGRITRGLSAETGGVWLTSFVSKYLHFHCPLVPVYDGNAARSIGRYVDWQVVAATRESMADLPDWARAYRNFAAAFIVLYERVLVDAKVKPSVKEVDYMLWRS